MRKMTLLLTIFFFGAMLHGQQVVNLEEGKPYAYNGLEYGYYISNESSKEVKGEDYERYEINLTVTNNSSCMKLIPLRTGWSGNTGSTNSQDDIMIAEFNCTNATGKRLTAKKGTVSAKPWYSNVRIPDESVKDIQNCKCTGWICIKSWSNYYEPDHSNSA